MLAITFRLHECSLLAPGCHAGGRRIECCLVIRWACSAGFALQFVIGPLGEWVSMLMGHPVKFPQMDLGTRMPLLFGMLGLGAYRTAEKMRGVAV